MAPRKGKTPAALKGYQFTKGGKKPTKASPAKTVAKRTGKRGK